MFILVKCFCAAASSILIEMRNVMEMMNAHGAVRDGYFSVVKWRAVFIVAVSADRQSGGGDLLATYLLG